MKAIVVILTCALVTLATACGDSNEDGVGLEIATPTATPAPTKEPEATSHDGIPSAENRTFDEDPVGESPSQSEVFSGTWAVQADADAPSSPNVLCQTATAEFPALSLETAVYEDVVISARFKPTTGEVDRAAGIIFRVADAGNYYIVRANALEDNVDVYKYVDGERSFIAGGVAEVPADVWQELRVEVEGDTIRGFLSGELVVEVQDSTFSTGQVGLWTKADSVTCFDSIQIEAR